ncbi:signal peptidase I [Clostridium sediminicola]|uniref:signal peptidase I n=1 Tax=Clostridium sediminicola TaxID=3114879 RepID=UPI0031F22483
MKLKEFLKDWIIPILFVVIVGHLIRSFVCFTVQVPTPSMDPTIKPGDRIFVTKIYNTNKLKRGDIIFFKSDERQNELIKRLIGLPGEEILIDRSGTIYVNGELLNESYVVYPEIVTPEKEAIRFKVPEGNYLFLGDNRANSRDSRYWDNPYIEESKLLGKARFILFPFKRFGKF